MLERTQEMERVSDVVNRVMEDCIVWFDSTDSPRTSNTPGCSQIWMT